MVSSGTHGSYEVLVAVVDAGRERDSKSLEHLFEAFYTRKPEGMGMGLAISCSIIEAHGGRLWATRHSPQGAILQCTLAADGEKVS